MLTIAEGEYKLADLAQALKLTESATRSRYRIRIARFNRPPTLLEMSLPVPPLKQSHLKRFKIDGEWLTVPEIATKTNLPEATVRRRYAALAKRQPKGITVADMLNIHTRKRRALTPRNNLIIQRAEEGESFASIGKAFGMSRQAAQQIYARGY